MAKSVKRKGSSGARRSSRHRSDRKPKLQAVPPPLPVSVPLPEAPGATEDHGPGIPAPLKVMDGWEPDFGGEFAGEAAIMIVERGGPGHDAEAAERESQGFSSLQDRLSATFAEIEVEAIAAAFCEPIGEAAVEIFERPEIEPESHATGATRLPKGHRLSDE